MKTRILSLLLALALLCTVLPQFTLSARAEEVYSGACGEHLTWSFDPGTGTLTIAGSGAMCDYIYGFFSDYCYSDIPWDSYRSEILHVVLPAGLTYIGSSAFYGCTGLTQLTLPAGLTRIGWNAFEGCTGLTQITLPAGLAGIDSSAFKGCTGLTAFSVASDNPNFSSNAGVVFNKEGSELVLYPCGRTGAYTVPAGVTSIGGGAFEDCTGLTQLTLPDALTEIGEYAFYGCTGLTQLKFPAGLTEIGEWAFAACIGLTQLSLPDGLTEIGKFAFSGCIGLTQITLPDALTRIGGSAFGYCTGLTQLTFPDGLTYIGDGAFSDCTGLTQITFPDGLTAIGWHAFYECTGLTDVVIPASVTEIGGHAFGYWCDADDGNYKPIASFIIYGYKETAAQTYAQENGFRFIPLDPQSGFADVKPKHYYYNAMLWALERGITSGTSRVTFSPNDTCTRGQVMTFLYAAKGKPEADWSNNPFVDVKKSKYYYKPVLWANQNGITNGVDDTHFQPNGGCTRAQVVTFLWALSGKPNPKAGSNPFKDVKKSNWYYQAVLWAYQNGITSGVDATHFGPNQTCTRGQVVTFLYALLGKK